MRVATATMKSWDLEPFGRLPRYRLRIVRGWIASLVGATPARVGRDAGLLLQHSRRLHTWFSRDAVDVVFLDALGQILDVAAGVPPRCWVCGEPDTCHVLVLPQGLRRRTGLCIGDRIEPPGDATWPWQSSLQGSGL